MKATKKVYKLSVATRRKMSIAAKRRHLRVKAIKKAGFAWGLSEKGSKMLTSKVAKDMSDKAEQYHLENLTPTQWSVEYSKDATGTGTISASPLKCEPAPTPTQQIVRDLRWKMDNAMNESNRLTEQIKAYKTAIAAIENGNGAHK